MPARANNDLIHWVHFFLNGVAQTATKGRDVFRHVLASCTEVEHTAMGMGKRATLARQALNLLYRRPVIEAGDLKRALGVTTPTVNAFTIMIENIILAETTGQQRGRVYAFHRCLELFLG